MTSKYFKSLFIVVLIAAPLFAFAAPQDYLYVSLDYDYTTHAFSNLSADQRVVDSFKVVAQDIGDYTMTLEDKSGLVSQTKFSIPADSLVESLGNQDQGGRESKTSAYSATIALELPKSISVEDSNIIISKGNQILLKQKLSEISIQILKADTSRIIIPSQDPSFPPFASGGKTPMNIWLLSGLVVLLIIILGAGIFIFVRKSKNSQIPPPPPPASPSL